jgi:hypothetical protein
MAHVNNEFLHLLEPPDYMLKGKTSGIYFSSLILVIFFLY